MTKKKTLRVIRSVCGAIGAASGFLALGVVGGIETQSIDLIPGFIAASLLIGAFALFLKIADALTPARRSVRR